MIELGVKDIIYLAVIVTSFGTWAGSLFYFKAKLKAIGEWLDQHNKDYLKIVDRVVALETQGEVDKTVINQMETNLSEVKCDVKSMDKKLNELIGLLKQGKGGE